MAESKVVDVERDQYLALTREFLKHCGIISDGVSPDFFAIEGEFDYGISSRFPITYEDESAWVDVDVCFYRPENENNTFDTMMCRVIGSIDYIKPNDLFYDDDSFDFDGRKELNDKLNVSLTKILGELQQEIDKISLEGESLKASLTNKLFNFLIGEGGVTTEISNALALNGINVDSVTETTQGSLFNVRCHTAWHADRVKQEVQKALNIMGKGYYVENVVTTDDEGIFSDFTISIVHKLTANKGETMKYFKNASRGKLQAALLDHPENVAKDYVEGLGYRVVWEQIFPNSGKFGMIINEGGKSGFDYADDDEIVGLESGLDEKLGPFGQGVIDIEPDARGWKILIGPDESLSASKQKLEAAGDIKQRITDVLNRDGWHVGQVREDESGGLLIDVLDPYEPEGTEALDPTILNPVNRVDSVLLGFGYHCINIVHGEGYDGWTIVLEPDQIAASREKLDAAIPTDKPPLTLVDQDGNAFNVLGLAQRAARKAGWSKEQIDEFMNEATAGDYDELLATCMKYFNVD